MISLGAPALVEAQLAATIARADAGAGHAELRVYSTAMPTQAGAHGDAPMCVIALDKPCAELVDGALVFLPTQAAMVTAAGLPRWAEWVAGDGAQLHVGDVTDRDHDGFYRVEGAATPVGESSPMFYAGGLMTVSTSALT